MNRDHTSYLVLHYGFLLAIIFTAVIVVDMFVTEVSVWLGVTIAVVVGLGYPMALKRVGIAPTQWS